VFCPVGFSYLKKKNIRTRENSTPPTATSCFVVVIEEGSTKALPGRISDVGVWVQPTG